MRRDRQYPVIQGRGATAVNVRYEIELKAWVDDRDAVLTALNERCVFVRRFRKSDRYFELDGRRETSFMLLETDDSAVVAFKEKEVRDGVEYNREHEFGITGVDVFLALLERIGCEEYLNKVKTGLQFAVDGITVELVTVQSLGEFIEVEILEPGDNPHDHDRAARRIRQFLADIGVDDRRIESRSYGSLLRGDEVSEDLPGH
jgi:predicted adenylyl cyclase CyaB